jgi:hypothetical protein
MYQQLKLEAKSRKIDDPYCRTLRVVSGVFPGNDGIAWGVDPGVNFGLTIIEDEEVTVLHGSFLQRHEPGQYGLTAYLFLKYWLTWESKRSGSLIIEGAAYGAPYRQVELAEIRTGFYLAGAMHMPNVQIVPPATIRKAVFGYGKTQAGDVWPQLNHNAADSLSMALYLRKEIEQHE